MSNFNVKNSPSERLNWLSQGKFDDIIESMTLEEKVGQVFFSFLYGTELTSLAKKTIEECKLGNIIYYSWANELTDPVQVKKLSESIQEHSKNLLGIPSLIAIDQEGGVVSRLTKNFTEFPGNMALAATKNTSLAQQVGRAMGKEMKAVGISMTFAPVIDINHEKNNPVIGTRSFGDVPEIIVQFARAIIKGLFEAGIFNCLKHFPGHGRTQKDSHKELPKNDIDKKELYENELRPFFDLQGVADAIMTAHILVPSVDPENCASTSAEFLTKILREEIKYQGLVISDSLVMKGIVSKQDTLEETVKGVADAAIKAFNAGSDCLILGRLEWATFENAKSPEVNQQLTFQVLSAFKQAVQDKRIPLLRLNESVKRVLLLKPKMLKSQLQDLDIVKCEAHIKLAEEVARKALTLASPEELLKATNTKISNRKVKIIAPESIKDRILQAKERYPSISVHFFKNQDCINDVDISQIKDEDLIIFLSFNAHLYEDQKKLLKNLSNAIPEKKLVIAGLRNPQDVLEDGLHKKHLVYLTYSHIDASINALLESLENPTIPSGVLPMSL